MGDIQPKRQLIEHHFNMGPQKASQLGAAKGSPIISEFRAPPAPAKRAEAEDSLLGVNLIENSAIGKVGFLRFGPAAKNLIDSKQI